MTAKIVISTLLISSLAAPCAASQQKTTVPKVEGGSVALDPHVAEFEAAMKTAISSLIAVRTAIQAIPVPPISKSAALAAGAKSVAEFAATASIMTAAEAAHQKFLTHLMGFQADELDIRLGLAKQPAFDQKNDANVRPKADKIMQGNFAPSSAGSGGGGTGSRVAAPAAAAPKFAPVSSPFSYGSGGGTQFGMGFEGTLGGGTQGGAAGAISGGGQTAGGGGVATGAGDRAASGSTSTGAPDVAPSANPGADQISKNTSNVAELAAQRMKERQEAAEQAAEQRRQEEKQRKQQQQQMMMMAGQMAAQVGGQLAQAAAANSEKQGESNSAAAAAPLP